MYNIVVVKVSVVRISSFSLLRLASGYTLNWLPVTEKLKKLLQTQFGLDAICSGSGRYLLEDFFPSNMQEICVRENKKTNANCTQHKLHHTTKLYELLSTSSTPQCTFYGSPSTLFHQGKLQHEYLSEGTLFFNLFEGPFTMLYVTSLRSSNMVKCQYCNVITAHQ